MELCLCSVLSVVSCLLIGARILFVWCKFSKIYFSIDAFVRVVEPVWFVFEIYCVKWTSRLSLSRQEFQESQEAKGPEQQQSVKVSR